MLMISNVLIATMVLVVSVVIVVVVVVVVAAVVVVVVEPSCLTSKEGMVTLEGGKGRGSPCVCDSEGMTSSPTVRV